MPLSIAMGMIKANTDCNGGNQHHNCVAPKHSWDKHSSNPTRRAVAISLGATRRPCQQTWQRQHEDVMSIMVMLIPQQQSLSKERPLPQCKRNKRNQEPGGPLNEKPQADWAYSCLRSPATRISRSTTWQVIKNWWKTIIKHSHVTLAPRVMRTTLSGQATHTSDWHRLEQQWNKRELQQQQQRQKLPSSFW